eukprot:TRINITY_DN11096_c0_g1_i1.p1 TRINITY_DN11096_c0_g1~~TRINITY_DN11096_c0_g1_i1.p1  ORF type:complete len:297 (+),score=59.13 TRINITY_DN11096_c0_g1_i1:1475-2365(+)
MLTVLNQLQKVHMHNDIVTKTKKLKKIAQDRATEANKYKQQVKQILQEMQAFLQAKHAVSEQVLVGAYGRNTAVFKVSHFDLVLFCSDLPRNSDAHQALAEKLQALQNGICEQFSDRIASVSLKTLSLSFQLDDVPIQLHPTAQSLRYASLHAIRAYQARIRSQGEYCLAPIAVHQMELFNEQAAEKVNLRTAVRLLKLYFLRSIKWKNAATRPRACLLEAIAVKHTARADDSVDKIIKGCLDYLQTLDGDKVFDEADVEVSAGLDLEALANHAKYMTANTDGRFWQKVMLHAIHA